MTINRTTLLDLSLPVTGTESGVWGDITNNALTQYLDIAIAGRTALTSSDFTAGALTIALTEGDASATNIVATSAQYGTLYVSSLAANSTITAPASNRAYRVVNADATYTLTVKASGQTGVTFPVSSSGVVVFNGTDYVLLGTYAPIFNVDNLRLDGNTLSSTNTNGNITLAPNGTGRVEVSGTSSNAGGINFYEDTDNGTNKALLTAPAALGSDVTLTLPDVTSTLGYINTPINSQSAAYTLVLADAAKTILHPASDDNARTFTIPANSSVPYPDGTVITFVNLINTVTIAITSDTMYLAGPGTTGSRTLAAYGVASAVKVASTTWVISGNGLT
jgi:hypothetical protein